MKYRSRTDIAAALLEIAKGGAIKTRMMYGAFLSYPQLKEYLDLMLENGLLERNKEQNMYFTTEKGMQFLNTYKQLDKMVPKENMLTKTAET